MSNGLTVTINRTDEVITISPAKLHVPYGGTTGQTITWSASNCKITNVQLLDGDGSVWPPKKIDDHTWQAIDVNDNKTGQEKRYLYAITIDPEIMNDPDPGGSPPLDEGE